MVKKNDRNTELGEEIGNRETNQSRIGSHIKQSDFSTYATAVVGAAVATGAASVLASTAATAATAGAAGAAGAAATAASTAGAEAGTEAASALVGQSREMWPAWAHL
jgi:hypothetical protein